MLFFNVFDVNIKMGQMNIGRLYGVDFSFEVNDNGLGCALPRWGYFHLVRFF